MYDTFKRDNKKRIFICITIIIFIIIGIVSILFYYSKSTKTFRLEQKEVNLAIDNSYQITFDKDSEQDNKKYKYESKDENIVKVDDNGLITPVSGGSTEVIVKRGNKKSGFLG